MLCKNPYVAMGRAYGCGQCMPCRLNKRRLWTHRLMLEAAQYEDNAFVTLTYADENLPVDGNLVPADVQKWLKRVRKGIEPHRIRFFVVGEYGETSFRPHYHAALFNYPGCYYGVSEYSSRKLRCCAACDYLSDTWGKGNVLVGRLEERSAAYLCGYVTKKMTNWDDPRLEGRHPEFTRMSLKPGIGGDFVHDIADPLLHYDLVKDDVPTELQHGRSKKPLGRYLTGRLREVTGRAKEAPQSVHNKIDEEMLPVRLAARASEDNPSVKRRLIEANQGKVASLEAREKLYKRGKVL